MLTYHDISDSLHALGCLYSSCDLTSGPMLSPVTPVTPCDTLWSSVGALSVSQTNQKLASYSSAKYLWFMTGATGLQQGSQGVTGVTGDTMGPLVRSHDDYRHPRTCKLSLISWYLSILKIYGKIYGQFWAAINQAIKLAKFHEIWPDGLHIGWLSCIKISQHLHMNCALYSC